MRSEINHGIMERIAYRAWNVERRACTVDSGNVRKLELVLWAAVENQE
jgi:hypothetical protein